MRPGLLLALMSALSACTVTEQFCLDDADQDGLCGDDDPCPVDPLNDADLDGICGTTDICDQGDDLLDADLDGLPDACDACEEDPYNDPDEDEVCTLVDPCPDDPSETCTRTVLVGLQVDYFAGETSWRVTDEAGNAIDAGMFTTPGEGVFRTYEVPVDAGALCVELHDDYGDGGVNGWVWDETFRIERDRWDAHSWSDDYSSCFELTGGLVTEDLPTLTEADFLGGLNTCRATIRLDLKAYGNEVGWRLGTAQRREIMSIGSGSYPQAGAIHNHDVELWDGQWVFVMQDSYGDGWDQGGFFDIFIEGEGEAVAHGDLPSGNVGTVPFTVRCP